MTYSNESLIELTLLTLLKLFKRYMWQWFWMSRVISKDPTQPLLIALLTQYFVLQNIG